MGHHLGDNDSYGAAIGLYRAITTMGKKAYVVTGTMSSSVKPLIDKFTTDNGYETLEIMLGYEDAMVFDYYLINGDKMAFISASTYSNDENLYDSLEEYTKEVVNSFKWNE